MCRLSPTPGWRAQRGTLSGYSACSRSSSAPGPAQPPTPIGVRADVASSLGQFQCLPICQSYLLIHIAAGVQSNHASHLVSGRTPDEAVHGVIIRQRVAVRGGRSRWDWLEATTGPVMLWGAIQVYKAANDGGTPGLTILPRGSIYPIDWRNTVWGPKDGPGARMHAHTHPGPSHVACNAYRNCFLVQGRSLCAA